MEPGWMPDGQEGCQGRLARGWRRSLGQGQPGFNSCSATDFPCDPGRGLSALSTLGVL